ncbi:MAG: prepilin-type N-terminal cleavage/methylation domain-containing protein [Deltaproteobacteria bacterium]|nr:prepilin-type N-terminal cleavage/methylation domain-containing protein [Deltaproteobacteria bacterium]
MAEWSNMFSRLRSSGQEGFTLIELAVSMVVSALIVSVLVGLFSTTTKAFFRQQEVAELQSNLRFATEIMRADFERAGFMLSPVVSAEHVNTLENFVPLPVMYNQRVSAGDLFPDANPDGPIITLVGNYASGTSYPYYPQGSRTGEGLACYPASYQGGATGARIGTPGCMINNPASPEANDPRVNPYYSAPGGGGLQPWQMLFCNNQMVHIMAGGTHAYSRLTATATAGGNLTMSPPISLSGEKYETDMVRISPVHFVSYQEYQVPGPYDPLSDHAINPVDGTQVSVWRIRRIVEDACLVGRPTCQPCNPPIQDLAGNAINACCTDIMEDVLPYTTNPNTSGFSIMITRDRNQRLGLRGWLPDPRLALPTVPPLNQTQPLQAINSPLATPLGDTEGIDPELPAGCAWNPSSNQPCYRDQLPWSLRSVMISLRGHTLHEDPGLTRLPPGAVLPIDAYDLVRDGTGPPIYRNGLARVRSIRTVIFLNNIIANIDPRSGS